MAQSPLERFIERELRLEHALTAAVKNPFCSIRMKRKIFD